MHLPNIRERESPSVYIVRNLVWNDFIAQIASVPHESPQDSLGKEMLMIQKFLKSHQTPSPLSANPPAPD